MDERDEGPVGGPAAPEGPAGGSEAPGAGDAGGDGAAARGREWLRQLETMIEEIATQAAPTVRQIGIKAAELAAVAGDKAGPFAQRAAEVTGEAGQRLAERSRALADELRRDVAGGGSTPDSTAVEVPPVDTGAGAAEEGASAPPEEPSV